MEEALLGGKSSGGGTKDKKIGHRSDAFAYGSSCQKAAALVDLVIKKTLLLPCPRFPSCLRRFLFLWAWHMNVTWIESDVQSFVCLFPTSKV